MTELRSIQAIRSPIFVTPGVFSAGTRSPSRRRSSVIAPSSVTIPFSTETRTEPRGGREAWTDDRNRVFLNASRNCATAAHRLGWTAAGRLAS